MGPGFKKAFLPGYPARKDSPVRESDFSYVFLIGHLIGQWPLTMYSGRSLREIDFDCSELRIGGFNAFDFFGDGSFYLLDTPGHAIGHLCGLARTSTQPDTFIFMGGDLCHHSGELRPSPFLPLPGDCSLQSILQHSGSSLSKCPGASIEHLQISRGRKLDEPFFIPAMGYDIPTAIESIKKTQAADANSNVWFVFAHDDSLRDLVDFFPHDVNAWKDKGWAAKTKWSFLKDFHFALGSESRMAQPSSCQADVAYAN